MASEPVPEIPQDIITNILHRLPPKSLGRFKCVSKNWLAQISEPQFIKSHQNTHLHLIFDSNHTSLYSLPINQPNNPPINLTTTLKLPHTDLFIFHGSCNGLVFGSSDDFVNAHSLVIFNPTTKQSVELLKSSYEMVNNLLEIDIMYGFGYDSVSDDYKVVTISFFHYNYLIPPDNMSVHVYSLRNNNWRRVIDSPYDHSHGKSLPGVFVHGFLHWIAYKSSDLLPVIVAFSLADERFSEVLSPNLNLSGCRLVVVGEKLGLFVENEVWVMNEYGVRESWLKIVIHGLNEILIDEPKIFYDYGKIMLVSGDIMWVYDVKDESFCESVDLSRKIKGLKVKGAYVESLVSPNLR